MTGGCPPNPILPSRRSPRRLPGEDSGGGGGGWAGCPRCRRPPHADPVSHRGSVGKAVNRVDTDSMHPAISLVLPPITACPQELLRGHPAPCPPGTALTLQPEGTKCRAILDFGMMSPPCGVGTDTWPGPVLTASRQPSPAGVPGPSSPPIPVWRCCLRASSEVAWSGAGPGSPYLGSPGCRWGSDLDLHTGSTLCVHTPVYTELLPAPLLTQG